MSCVTLTTIYRKYPIVSMKSDSLRLCASEWRILKAMAELRRSSPEGVSGFDLKKSNEIQTGTWGEYRKRLESDYLIRTV